MTSFANGRAKTHASFKEAIILALCETHVEGGFADYMLFVGIR